MIKISFNKIVFISSGLIFLILFYFAPSLFSHFFRPDNGFFLRRLDLFRIFAYLAIFFLCFHFLFAFKEKSRFEPFRLKFRENRFVKGGWLTLYKLVLVAILGAGTFWAVNLEIKGLAAEYYFCDLQQAIPQNKFIVALDSYHFIKEVKPHFGYYDRQFISIMLSWSRRINEKPFFALFNKEYWKILPQIRTDNFDDLLAKANIYASFAMEDGKYFGQAEEAYKKLSLMRPESMAVKWLYADLLSAKNAAGKK